MKYDKKITMRNTIRDYVKDNNQSLSEEDYNKICKRLFDNIDDIFIDDIWNSINEECGQEYEPYYLYNKYLYAISHDKKDPNYHFKIIESFPINVKNETIFYNKYFALSILKIDKIRKPKENEFEEVKVLNDEKIVVSIGLNPSGFKKNETKDKVKEMKDSILKSPTLEATRRNAIKEIMSILEKENASLKYFVQLDLYTDRSNNARDCELEMKKFNVHVIRYWLEKADIIIPAWGSRGPSLDPLLISVVNDILKYKKSKSGKEIYKIESKEPYKCEHFAARKKIKTERLNKNE